MNKEIGKFLKKEMLSDPPLSSKEMGDLNELLTKTLRESDQQTRDELRAFLKKWETRILFVDALQERKDMQDVEETKKNR